MNEQLNKIDLHKISLHISSACNLSCPYCFAKHTLQSSKKQSRMSDGIYKKGISLLLKHVDKRRRRLINVHFLGGEPLLNYDGIQRCVKYTKNLKHKNVGFTYSITTNGTLLKKEQAKYLMKNGFRVFLSMDSYLEDQHNHIRHFANGKGSFNSIKRVIELMGGYDKLTAQIAYTSHQKYFYETLQYLSRRNIMSKISYIAIPRGQDKCLEPSAGAFRKDLKRYASNLQSTIGNNYHLIPSPLKEYLYMSLDVDGEEVFKNAMCHAASKTISLSCDGIFYACDALTGHDPFELGNINDGLNMSAIMEFLSIRKKRCMLNKCKRCIYHTRCWGGCTAFSYFHCKQSECVDNKYCAFVKALFEGVELIIKAISQY